MTETARHPRPMTSWPPPTSADTSAHPQHPSVGLLHAPDHPATWLALLPVRLFLAAGWLRAGIEKVIDPDWWRGDTVRTYLVVHHDAALPFARGAMDSTLRPAAVTVAAVVVVAELACGLALAIGVRLRDALWIGVVLNVAFVATGQVNPSTFYLVMELGLLLALAGGTIGPHRGEAWRPRWYAWAACFAATVGFAPFIRTLDPKHVIDDPAVTLSFLSLLSGIGLALASHHAGRAAPDLRVSVWGARISAWSRAGIRSSRRRTEPPPPPANRDGPAAD
jgi:uncharacterized membrane protein YphA (DoxX/SURF4 family)